MTMWTWTGDRRGVVFRPLVEDQRLPRAYEEESFNEAAHPPPEWLDAVHAVLLNGAVVRPRRDGLTLWFDQDLPDGARVVAGDQVLYVVKVEHDAGLPGDGGATERT